MGKVKAMRVLLQRVSQARVSVDGAVVGAIGPGLLLLVAIGAGDGEDQLRWMQRKLLQFRVFNDNQGRMNRSVLETGGGILAVSQFTLYADTSRGNRPGYTQAAPPAQAQALYEQFCTMLEQGLGQPVARGVFGASMQVELTNDGPVTILLER
jgi:D-aminoacyl-tRNA deacylase